MLLAGMFIAKLQRRCDFRTEEVAKSWRRGSRVWMLGLLVSSLPAIAQIAGRINGRVLDASGASIANVRLTVTESDTKVSRVGLSDANGFYEFADVLPGKYTLEAEAARFQRQVISNMTLEVAQVLRQDLNLQLGAANERVDVTASAVALQTEDSQVGSVVGTTAVNDLPLNGRDFTQLMGLLPGASEGTPGTISGGGTTNRHYNERVAGEAFSVNGQRSNYNEFLIDGFMDKEVQSGTAAASPIIDSLMEFRVQTSNYSAVLGTEAGGQINTVLKSGTNDLHGTVWEYLRNDDFDANDFFSNLSGQPKGEYRRNQFGAAAGGPVLLPKYNGRNRTFIYGAFEDTQIVAAVTPTLTTVPTANQRQGIFTSVVDDPLTGLPFPNNQIPATRINSIANTLLHRWVPLPNNGTGTLNYYSDYPSRTSGLYSNLRIDHHISDKDHIFGHYLFNDTSYHYAKIFPTDGTSDNTRGQNVLGDWTHIFDPRTLNDFHIGYMRFFENEYEIREYKENVLQELGITGLCENPNCWGIPQEQVTGFQTFGEHGGQPQSGPRGWSNQVYQIQDVFSHQAGSHSISFGLAANQNFNNYPETIQPRGVYSYDGRFSGGAGNLNNSMSDYLLGLPYSTALSTKEFDPHLRYKTWAPFIQDDWRVSSELTVNLGFRYEINERPRAKHNAIVNILLDPSNGTAQVVTGQNPGNLPPELMYMDWHDFDPRVGFAYNPKALGGKTVFRSAYGIFSQRESQNSWVFMADNPPFIETASVTINKIPTSPLYFGNYNLANPYGLAAVALPSINSMAVNFLDGRVQMWNFDMQQSLTPTMLLDINYVGNHGSHLPLLTVQNQRQPGPGATTTDKPYPAFNGISLAEPVGDSNYNGLQVKLEKRYSSGVQFISAYTYSKCISNGDATGTGEGGPGSPTIQDPYDLAANRGPCAQDARQRYSLSAIYALPFGKGRAFLSRASRAEDALFGGWQINGILTLRTGQPLTVIMSSDIANDGGTTWANVVGNPNAGGARTIYQWFNTAAFVSPAHYTYGDEGRNMVIGPPVNNLDLSLFKVVKVTERESFQFRAEFFNALNHAQFAAPAVTLGLPTFGEISSSLHPARQVQLALKFLF
jgi:hypothetical protein